MAERDFIDRLQAGRDVLRRAQENLARYTLTPEQRQALLEGMTRMSVPGDQLRSMVDMMEAFGPPLAQIEALREELASQREEVQALDARLAHLEAIAERLAIAGEQLVAYQEPFVRMASMLTGQEVKRPRPAAAGERTESESDEDTP
jgi:citrate synthase